MFRFAYNAMMFVPNQCSALAHNVLTAFVQIWANKVRSLLTVLGIIIAVTSIIVVVSFVQGFGEYVTNFLRGLGTNLMVVWPESVRGPRGERIRQAYMRPEDVLAVNEFAPAVRRTTPIVWTRAAVEFGRQRLDGVEIVGSSEAFQPIRNFYCEGGRFFGALDVEAATQVCVIGQETLRKLEADSSIVGDYVHLDGQRFKVIGTLEKKGSFMGENQDDQILIPWTTAVKMYPMFRDYIVFYAEAIEEGKIAEAEAQIVRILRQRHGLRPDEMNDFGIFKQDQILQEFGTIRLYATSVLAGIVSISLLVGGIGIMNVMLVSVTERTREIGLRKSVGARRRDILLQFLTEAVVLSTLGGAIGIGLGYGVGALASLHPSMVPVEVPLWSIALALGFSAGVGVFFGIVPAFKAAILHPIDALRHE
ncbi:MAG: multidrug ABC transporter substrate-binding protein [Planctomycetota bacterium]|nr:MAG: multidrug ABC transporter substrate-binding protein [Planctomycetota bacterium]